MFLKAASGILALARTLDNVQSVSLADHDGILIEFHKKNDFDGLVVFDKQIGLIWDEDDFGSGRFDQLPVGFGELGDFIHGYLNVFIDIRIGGEQKFIGGRVVIIDAPLVLALNVNFITPPQIITDIFTGSIYFVAGLQSGLGVGGEGVIQDNLLTVDEGVIAGAELEAVGNQDGAVFVENLFPIEDAINGSFEELGSGVGVGVGKIPIIRGERICSGSHDILQRHRTQPHFSLHRGGTLIKLLQLGHPLGVKVNGSIFIRCGDDGCGGLLGAKVIKLRVVGNSSGILLNVLLRLGEFSALAIRPLANFSVFDTLVG